MRERSGCFVKRTRSDRVAAAEARILYGRATDPDARLTYLQIEQCWHRLAGSYAFHEAA
jgi:hypothetical protein